MKRRDLIKALKRLGFEQDRIGKGSHEIWTNGSQSVVVPKRGRSDLGKKLGQWILLNAQREAV